MRTPAYVVPLHYVTLDGPKAPSIRPSMVSVGGVGAVVSGFVKFFGEKWAERLHERWKHGLERELESLKADLQSKQEILSKALTSGTAGFLTGQERREFKSRPGIALYATIHCTSDSQRSCWDMN